MKLNINDIGGDIVKDNETYLLKDNKLLNNLVVSSTLLHPFKQTNGHNHSGQEEVYLFVHGFGEMEIDCMIAHGASSFLKERLMDVSDKYSVFICNDCNMIVTGNSEKNIYECKKCKNYSNFNKVYIPYACSLYENVFEIPLLVNQLESNFTS